MGKATGIGFHMLGNEVLFHDIEKKKVAWLRKRGYEVAGNLSEAVMDSELSFVCVQTPTVDGIADLSFLGKAIEDIAEGLSKKGRYHTIAIRSTTLPTTTRTKIIPLLEKRSQLTAGIDFGVCTNPEFLRQANALSDFLNPSRIVIGGLDKYSGDKLEELYVPFKAPIFRTDLDVAEMIKYVSNAFLTTKISFFNEIYMLCKNLGFDPIFISETVALDPRIGNYGIQGGRAFGGKCLPKDLEAFISFIKSTGQNPKLLDAVTYINKEIVNSKRLDGKRHERGQHSNSILYGK